MARSTPAISLGIAMAFAGTLVATLTEDALALEIKKFAITDFTSECGGGDRDNWNYMVDGWYDEMNSEGHPKDGAYVNGNMTIQRFCDPDWNADCRDHQYMDEADAFILGTHGYDGGDHWQGGMRWRWNGHCRIDGGGSSSEMSAGDFDAEFATMSSCNSADDDNIPGIRRAMYDPVDSPVNGRRLHQWDGFHGCMYINSSRRGDYVDVADDGHDGSISDAWVYNQKDSKQCPVAYAISTSLSACLVRLNYERYNYVYSDPPGNTYYCWKAFWLCDPACDDPFDP